MDYSGTGEYPQERVAITADAIVILSFAFKPVIMTCGCGWLRA
jgi:hypothetical protein